VQWQEAIAAAPDYVLITSLNEWHEGSEIEASVEYGSRILDETVAFSRAFLGGRR
jgi:glycoprotein endo-alpha-1,2-mannosidase